MEAGMNTDKRANERHLTMGLMSTVSDGKGAYLGVVEDISTAGVCLSQVPAVFDDGAEHCFTVVKGGEKDYKIVLRPCWARATNRGMYKVIGFQIEDPTESWKDFVNRITQESDSLHILFSGNEVAM